MLDGSGLAGVAVMLEVVPSKFAMAKLLKINPVAIVKRSNEISKKAMAFFKLISALYDMRRFSVDKSVFVQKS